MSELARLKGVGKARLEVLQKAGIADAQALIRRFPREYVFFSEQKAFSAARVGEKALFRAKILSFSQVFARGLSIVRATLGQGEESMEAVWFNQPYLRSQLENGAEWLFYGLVAVNGGRKQLLSPLRYPLASAGVQPLYAQLNGLPSKTFGGLVQKALELAAFEETLPEEMRLRYAFPAIEGCYRAMHFPSSRAELQGALSRLAFEDLLFFQLAVLGDARKEDGIALSADESCVKPFLDLLGFALTGAQARVLGEILGDLGQKRPMARLVEGDVGSGKTALAFAALYCCAASGFQGALMAPTEVLAGQHYERALEWLKPLRVEPVLLTGSLSAKERRLARERLKSGEARVAIGTHALISEGVKYQNLALVITDEQHRFGVRQRVRLEQKGKAGEEGKSPHVLVMSATPIPRTMALALYGDLDISVVDELPPGRQKILTRLVPEGKREALYGFLRRNVEAGGQAYVICPLVEESSALDAANAVSTYEQMKKALPGLSIELLHGRMSGQQKQEALARFADGETAILVSTTVIEVGVNVPNATIMVIENAERFGLAQLHQLRGRVGRGTKQSWCFLMAEGGSALQLLVDSGDGFEIAQKDLELRGPGEFMGQRQHGLIDQRLLSLMGDGRLLGQARKEAEALLKRRGEPEIKRILELARAMAGEPARN
ncbi:MAG: ATP-dependent DNA helicase RecG [Christensenellaceae bacterium]|jgi:ATP-dependent DNA helicase RecG|nr:ATP-dependent DNA helicase RecG [Christensenellaceae bacterium]